MLRLKKIDGFPCEGQHHLECYLTSTHEDPCHVRCKTDCNLGPSHEGDCRVVLGQKFVLTGYSGIPWSVLHTTGCEVEATDRFHDGHCTRSCAT